jgi:hypothetical protein
VKKNVCRIVAFVAVASMPLLAGCGANVIEDRRDVCRATLVFREYKSSLYRVEVDGKVYMHNSAGGVCRVE